MRAHALFLRLRVHAAHSHSSLPYTLQDGYHMALIVSLEHPLRQGATTYPHLVLQLPKEACIT